MSDADKIPTSVISDDADDLDDLLDSALTDFDNPLSNVTQSASTSDGPTNVAKPADVDNESAQWGKEFQQFQNVMDAFLRENPLPMGNDTGLNEAMMGDLNSSLADTLKALAESAPSSSEPSADELSELLKSMGLDDTDPFKNEQFSDMLPVMQNVMRSLLSKELLYPSLKDIVSKYPDWLAENQPTLKEDVFNKYSMQYDLMKQVCDEFETCDETSEDAKNKSFENILMLMQKMQECGNPPKELLGEMHPDLPFDEEGNLKVGVKEQCAIM